MRPNPKGRFRGFKSARTTTLFLLASIAAAGKAAAQPYVVDQFINPGPLASTSSYALSPGTGFGWSINWYGSATGWQVQASQPIFPYLSPSLGMRGGSAYASTPGSLATRYFSNLNLDGAYRSGTTAWISFLIKQADDHPPYGASGILLNRDDGFDGAFVGTYYGQFRIHGYLNAPWTSGRYAGTSVSTFVLLKVQVQEQGGRIAMWINPDLASPTFPQPDAIAAGLEFQGGFYSVSLTSDLPGVSIDELRIAPERDAVIPLADTPKVWSCMDGGNNHAYLPVYVPQGVTWAAAQADAIARGGTLATCADAAENLFVFDTVATRTELWGDGSSLDVHPGPLLGARRTGSAWAWVDQTPWSYEAWEPGQPLGGQSSEPPFLRFLGGYFGPEPRPLWESGGYGEALSTGYIIEFPDALYEKPVDQVLVLGGNVTFHSKSANMAANYLWMHNGETIAPGFTPWGTFRDESGGDLIITNAHQEDLGIYTVTTYDPCGSPIASARLALPAETGPVLWSCSDFGNGHFYQVVRTPEGIAWDVAYTAAINAGGNLVAIQDSFENDFVFSLVSGEEALWPPDLLGNRIGPWLGGMQQGWGDEPDGGWIWSDYESMLYSNWAPGEPDNADPDESVMHFYGQGGQIQSYWNDASPLGGVNGVLPRAYIIEWASPLTQYPLDQFGECGGDATIQAGVVQVAPGILMFSWWKDGVQLFDGPTGSGSTVQGASTASLSISGLTGADQGVYELQISGDCLNFFATPYLTVTGCAPPCPADFNQDGGIDGADVSAFFDAWEAGDISADVNQDGGIDGSDVSTFFAAWEAGGC